jgi:hypothetical protein
MEISHKDKQILRQLGERKAEIALLAIQQERKEMWTRVNRVEPVKPLIWFDDICWNEMNVDDELTLQTKDRFCRRIERRIRREIYRWEHIQGDTVVEPVVYGYPVVRDTGFGIEMNIDRVQRENPKGIQSVHFNPVIKDEGDIEKIRLPEVTYDKSMTEEYHQALEDIFDGIIAVERSGIPGFWFAPWDEIVMWTGIQEALMDLAVRPDYIHKLIDRVMEAHLHRLDQYETLNLLSPNNLNVRIGSGAYGYTDQLPGEAFDERRVRASDLWGCSTAQIFVGVSPQMHWEFALQYEIRWLARFGLSYYGCCEPLHDRIGYLRKIPNLRKISMSPWANIEEAKENGADNFVLSIKPSPAILARDKWDLDLARKDLSEKLDQAKGCAVEVIMKDISTVRNEPKRLWEWAEMASRLSERYS